MGVITIPLMKASGFGDGLRPGSRRASSTGGQVMPPIMELGRLLWRATSIPTRQIVAVSVIPAFLASPVVAFVVRIEAVKHRVGEGVDMSISRAKFTQAV